MNEQHKDPPKYHILWVDDNPAHIRFAVMILEREYDAEVDLAQTVETGLRKLVGKHYDLLLLDLMLPRGCLTGLEGILSPETVQIVQNSQHETEGLGLLRVLRAGVLERSGSPNKPSMPVVIHSAAVSDSEAAKYGAAILRRPAMLHELTRVVGDLLSKRTTE